MSDHRLYHNPNCSKSRGALELLQQRDLDFQTIEYLATPLAAATLGQRLDLLGCDPGELVRKDKKFKELDRSREFGSHLLSVHREMTTSRAPSCSSRTERRALQLRAMVTIGMNYEVIPGKEEAFEGACKKVIDVMGDADGHDESQLFRRVDKDDSAQYLIVSQWSDEDAFNAFVASDTFKKVTNWGKENILAGRPSHTTYQHG